MTTPMTDNVTVLPRRVAERSSQAPKLQDFENDLYTTLRAALAHLEALYEYVHATRPFDEANRKKAYELRIVLQQEVEAVRWRTSKDLMDWPVPESASTSLVQRIAAINRYLSEECAAIEDEANKAWAHLCTLVDAVRPLP